MSEDFGDAGTRNHHYHPRCESLIVDHSISAEVINGEQFPSREYSQLSALAVSGVAGTLVYDPAVGVSVDASGGGGSVTDVVTESFYSGNVMGASTSGGYLDLLYGTPTVLGTSLETAFNRAGATVITSPNVAGFYVGPAGEVDGKYLISVCVSFQVNAAVTSEFQIRVGGAAVKTVPFSTSSAQVVTLAVQYVADSDDYITTAFLYNSAINSVYHSIAARKISL